jgi:Mycothiol maleylpyruvate isomerase N-terminal domain
MTTAADLYGSYLDSAAVAVALLADPAVAAAWDQPSALAEFTVRGLAGHLARQVIVVRELLAAEPPAGQVVSLLDHYARAQWVGASLDHEASGMAHRGDEAAAARGAEAAAARGAAELVRGTAAALAELRAILPGQPDDRLIVAPGGNWLLTLPDFLVTRLVEFTVHADDLSVSVGVPAPDLPPQVTDTVLVLLTRLAARRHGPTAVLRALSRAERAPATIAAF